MPFGTLNPVEVLNGILTHQTPCAVRETQIVLRMGRPTIVVGQVVRHINTMKRDPPWREHPSEVPAKRRQHIPTNMLQYSVTNYQCVGARWHIVQCASAIDHIVEAGEVIYFVKRAASEHCGEGLSTPLFLGFGQAQFCYMW